VINVIHGSSDDKPKTTPGARNEEPLPAGTYEAEIAKSTARQSDFSKTSDNPDGWEISLWLDVQHNGKRFRVFESIPATHVNRINEVLVACDLPKLTPKTHRIEEAVLEGQIVGIRTYVTKGNKARVGDFMRPKVKTTPAKTVAKVDDSDIPF
jgi:hypothetical protein